MDIIKRSIIILFIFTLVGCVGCASVKTTITSPDKEIWVVQSKKDALVKLEKEGTKIEVDNRGKLGLFENLMGIIFMKTDIDLKNKGGD